MLKVKNKWFFLCTALMASLASASDMQTSYENDWRNDYNKALIVTLTKNNVRGCGDYKYKQHIKGSSEYVVYCSRDGKKWLMYQVWPKINSVLGPYHPDPSLN